MSYDKQKQIKATAKAAARNRDSLTTKTVKKWRVTSPEGKAYEFINLNSWLRSHTHLFNPDDVAIKIKSNGVQWSNAECGLRGALKTVKRQWRGWGVSREDVEEQPARSANCRFCGEPFEPTLKGTQVFCSPGCRREAEKLKYNKLTEKRKCEHCGVTFETSITHHVFCSARCRQQSRELIQQQEKDSLRLKRLNDKK